MPRDSGTQPAAPPSPRGRPASRGATTLNWPRLLPWMLVLVGVLVYVNSLPDQLVFDTTHYVLHDPSIRDLSNLGAILGGTRRELVKLSLAINWAIDGANPRGYHLFNMIVHILAGLTLFGLVRRTLESVGRQCESHPALSGEPRRTAPARADSPRTDSARADATPGDSARAEPDLRSRARSGPAWTPLTSIAPWLAFTVSLLWLVHPLNTQAVTYVIQRAESMMGLFYMLTLYCLLRLAQAQGAGAGDGPAEAVGSQAASTSAHGRFAVRSFGLVAWALAAVLACAAGMVSKEVMVTAPVAAVLFDRAFLGGGFRAVFARRWWLYLALCCTWALFLVGGLGGIVAPHSSAGFGTPVVKHWWDYLFSEGEVILHYLGLAVWPLPPNALVLDYQWLPAALVSPTANAWYWAQHLLLPDLIVAALLIVSLIGLWRNTWWGFVGFCFFLVLSVTSSVMPIADLAFEQRMYLPLTAVVVLAVFLGFKLLRLIAASPAGAQAIGGVIALAAACVFAGLTVQRNFEYRTRISIWTTVTHRAPNNPRGFHNLANALSESGRDRQAMAMYEQELRMLPPDASMTGAANNNIGGIWLKRGRLDKALAHFRRALKITPKDASVHYNLGRALLFAGRFDAAAQRLREAIELKANYPKAWNVLGRTLSAQGKRRAAGRAFRRALKLNPKMVGARYNLGIYALHEGRYVRAAAQLRRALKLDPSHAESVLYLARVLAVAPEASVRHAAEALALLRRYRRLRGGMGLVALDTLAAAYADRGRFDQALQVINMTIRQARRLRAPPSAIDPLEARRKLYQAHQPYRAPAGGEAPPAH